MAGGTTDPYKLAASFEQAVLRHLVFDQRFWSRVGNAVEPEAFSTPTAKLVAQAATAIGRETGKSAGSGALIVQRAARWRHEGRVTHEAVLDVDDLVGELEDLDPVPDPDAVADELVPVIRERRNREAVRLAMKRVANRDPMTDVIEHLQATASLGTGQAIAGVRFGPEALDAIRRLRTTDRLAMGIAELDAELGGGPPLGTLSVFMGGAGDGKCHAAGQGILMADGTVKLVEDVEVGDRIMAPNNTVRTVQRTNRGSGELFEIRPRRGRPWRVNADHVLTLIGTGEPGLSRWGGMVVDVSVRDWLGWSKHKRHNFKLWRAPVDVFDGGSRDRGSADLPLDPYFLGVLLGDGSFCNTEVRVSTPDAEIASAVGAYARGLGLSVTTYVKGAGRCVDYALVGTAGRKNPIAARLESLGLRGCKSGDKFIPQCYKTASRRDRLELLAGLIDTDGSRNKTAYDFVSKSLALAEDLAFVARSLGLAAHVTQCVKFAQTGVGGTYHRVGISGDVADVPLRVRRKRARRRLQHKNVRVTGFDVVPTGVRASYYGFTLDGDGRYLLDDFTVTHNSMALCQIGGSAILGGKNVLVATLELSEEQWVNRLMANVTGVPIDSIADGSMEDDAAARLKELHEPGVCFVGQFAPEATTVAELMTWVKAMEQRHSFSTDVLIVDYADLLGHTKSRDYEGMREVYSGLREEFAVKRSGWVWTASQSRRKQKPNQKQGADDGADSQHKIRVCDLWISLGASEDGSEIEWRISKNRGGRRGACVTLPTEFECARVVPLAESEDHGTMDLF